MALSEPVVLADVDLNKADQLMIDKSVAATACTSGRLDGILVYFELGLGPTTRLSIHPARVDENCSWRSLVWVLQPLTLEAGDPFEVTYRYRAAGASYDYELTVNQV